jgi:hypothetical protein
MSESGSNVGESSATAEVQGPEKSAGEVPGPAKAGEISGVPMEMFVREGTSTWASDMKAAEEFAKAEERRNLALRERQIAATERSEDGIASMKTNRLSENQGVPAGKVVLNVVNRAGSQIDDADGDPQQVVCDLIMGLDPMRPEDMVLVLVCPHCVLDRGVHQGAAQLTLSQRNRGWYLDQRKEYQNTVVVKLSSEVTGQIERVPVPVAGMVTDSDRIPCAQCSSVYRIDRNRLWRQ